MTNRIGRFPVGRRMVGDGAPCFLMAEVGLAHEGSLAMAMAYVDAAAEAGADAVKFQTHIAAEESTPREQFRVNVFPQDATRYDYWQRTAFTEEQWTVLKARCDARGVEFLSSPFSAAAVRLLRRVGAPAWKIGSGESNNPLLLEALAAGGEPVLLSTGMSYWREIGTAVDFFATRGIPLVLMQCTSRYPAPPETLGLNLIAEYARRFNCPAGFSDHSGLIAPGVAAAALGAKVIEVHVTWHRKSFGPDVPASLTIEEFAALVQGVRVIEKALAHPVDKDATADGMVEMRALFNKGLVAAVDLEPGRTITAGDLDAKKPCAGIPAADYAQVIGRTVSRRIARDGHITWADLA